MTRANSPRIRWFDGRLPMALGCALSLAVAIPAIGAEKPPGAPAWRADEDAEELDGSFEERVRDLQGWLRQRDAERRQSWGNDVITPENPALNLPPRYSGDRAYDPQGYRRLNENTRFRLRGQDSSWNFDEDSRAGSLRRIPGSLQEPQGDEAADSGDGRRTEAEPATRRGSSGKHKRRTRRR